MPRTKTALRLCLAGVLCLEAFSKVLAVPPTFFASPLSLGTRLFTGQALLLPNVSSRKTLMEKPQGRIHAFQDAGAFIQDLRHRELHGNIQQEDFERFATFWHAKALTFEQTMAYVGFLMRQTLLLGPFAALARQLHTEYAAATPAMKAQADWVPFWTAAVEDLKHPIGDALPIDLMDDPAQVAAATQQAIRERTEISGFADLETIHMTLLTELFQHIHRPTADGIQVEEPFHKLGVMSLFEVRFQSIYPNALASITLIHGAERPRITIRLSAQVQGRDVVFDAVRLGSDRPSDKEHRAPHWEIGPDLSHDTWARKISLFPISNGRKTVSPEEIRQMKGHFNRQVTALAKTLRVLAARSFDQWIEKKLAETAQIKTDETQTVTLTNGELKQARAIFAKELKTQAHLLPEQANALLQADKASPEAITEFIQESLRKPSPTEVRRAHQKARQHVSQKKRSTPIPVATKTKLWIHLTEPTLVADYPYWRDAFIRRVALKAHILWQTILGNANLPIFEEWCSYRALDPAETLNSPQYADAVRRFYDNEIMEQEFGLSTWMDLSQAARLAKMRDIQAFPPKGSYHSHALGQAVTHYMELRSRKIGFTIWKWRAKIALNHQRASNAFKQGDEPRMLEALQKKTEAQIQFNELIRHCFDGLISHLLEGPDTGLLFLNGYQRETLSEALLTDSRVEFYIPPHYKVILDTVNLKGDVSTFISSYLYYSLVIVFAENYKISGKIENLKFFATRLRATSVPDFEWRRDHPEEGLKKPFINEDILIIAATALWQAVFEDSGQDSAYSEELAKLLIKQVEEELLVQMMWVFMRISTPQDLLTLPRLFISVIQREFNLPTQDPLTILEMLHKRDISATPPSAMQAAS